MKDRQVEPDSGQARIPFVSAALHCISMTAVVYLRASFGFVYLRPRSVFFTFSYAFLLFTVYAWIEPGVWRDYWAVCLFGLGAVALYWLHLLRAFLDELDSRGAHDHHSGRSHSLRVLRWTTGRESTPRSEVNHRLWGEPGGVFLAALVLRAVTGERHLSAWLGFTAVCLWTKEAFNYWHHLRLRKRQRDTFTDAGDTVEPTSPNTVQPEPPKAARKARVKRQRNADEDAAKERRFAELLRLLPPYSLEKAEENYRTLIKDEHPDANEGTPESTARSSEFNAAIEFFRERLSG